MPETKIEIRGICKSYGGVRALAPLDLDLRAGEVHAICGENGAGKSTLNRILSGSVLPDSGSITIAGSPMQLGSIAAAEGAGIAIVHQESAVFFDLTAAENFQLVSTAGNESQWWLDREGMRERTRAALATFGETFNVDVELFLLSLAQRQMLSIASATDKNCRLLILDEPTASLSHREVDTLLRVVRDLRSRGVAILYVSHRLEEIFTIADRVSVLRDGELIQSTSVGHTSPSNLVKAMVGRSVEFEKRTAVPPGEVRLKVSGLSRRAVFQNVSFEVRAGEVVGLAGLIGAGRSEVARVLAGIESPDSGTIDSARHRVALVPEDRQHEGLHLSLPIRENLSLAASVSECGLVDRRGEAISAQGLISKLNIKAADDKNSVASLSGGNQQKVLLGKWLGTNPGILILDEPTRGVDVGSKDQIHRHIDLLARSGVAILLISSEMSEIVALSDRVLVMRQGSLVAELTGEKMTQEAVLQAALPSDEAITQRVVGQHGWSRQAIVGCLLLTVFCAVTAINPTFLSVANLRDLLIRVAPSAIIGVAMTLIILAREIDISVGSLMGLSAAALGIAASPTHMGLPPGLAAVICVAVGAAGGVVNGVLVAKARIPSIIVTLGTLTLFKGATQLLLGGKWIEDMPPWLRSMGSGVPIVLLAVAVSVVGWWITKRTRFGLQVYALGSNPSAADLTGIPEGRIRLILFALTGGAAGLVALFSATQLQIIESGFGSGFELVAIAAVIVGGTSIRGGRGTIGGTIIGASLLGIISSSLIFLRLGQSATYWERAIQGGVILLAVLGDHIRRKERR